MSGIREIKAICRNLLPAKIYRVMGGIYNKTVMLTDSVLATFGKLRIRFLVVSVGQACNFKCRNCGNFAPISPAECRRYKLEDIINSFESILKNVDKIINIQIQGGGTVPLFRFIRAD